VEHVDIDEPLCVDMLKPDDLSDDDVVNSRRVKSVEMDEIDWNVDRIDKRLYPLDGDYCPLVNGNKNKCMHINSLLASDTLNF